MSQLEPSAVSSSGSPVGEEAMLSQSVGSEGVPQSTLADSAAPVSVELKSTGLRLNPNAVEFIPLQQLDQQHPAAAVSSSGYQPPFLPVYQQGGFVPINDGRKKYGRQHQSGAVGGAPLMVSQYGMYHYHQQQSGLFYPAGSMHITSMQQPDAHLYYASAQPFQPAAAGPSFPVSHSRQKQQHQQQQPAEDNSATKHATSQVQHIMLTQALDFPELGAASLGSKGGKKFPSTRPTPVQQQQRESSNSPISTANQPQTATESPAKEEDETVDSNAPITVFTAACRGRAHAASSRRVGSVIFIFVYGRSGRC